MNNLTSWQSGNLSQTTRQRIRAKLPFFQLLCTLVWILQKWNTAEQRIPSVRWLISGPVPAGLWQAGVSNGPEMFILQHKMTQNYVPKSWLSNLWVSVRKDDVVVADIVFTGGDAWRATLPLLSRWPPNRQNSLLLSLLLLMNSCCDCCCAFLFY